VDTGASYRAATLLVLRPGIPVDDAVAVAAAVRDGLPTLELSVDPWEPGVTLAGEDVASEIRGAEVTSAVSAVSSIPAVREQLIAFQRQLIGRDGAVVEGRDIATVVAPHAALKIYLDAPEDVRARRRAAQLVVDATPSEADAEAQGQAAAASRVAETRSLEEIQRALRHRDEADSRTNALRATEGAVHLETGSMSLDEVVDAVIELAVAVRLVDPEARAAQLAGPRGSGDVTNREQGS
jgi:cytidylate kinase